MFFWEKIVFLLPYECSYYRNDRTSFFANQARTIWLAVCKHARRHEFSVLNAKRCDTFQVECSLIEVTLNIPLWQHNLVLWNRKSGYLIISFLFFLSSVVYVFKFKITRWCVKELDVLKTLLVLLQNIHYSFLILCFG